MQRIPENLLVSEDLELEPKKPNLWNGTQQTGFPLGNLCVDGLDSSEVPAEIHRLQRLGLESTAVRCLRFWVWDIEIWAGLFR